MVGGRGANGSSRHVCTDWTFARAASMLGVWERRSSNALLKDLARRRLRSSSSLTRVPVLRRSSAGRTMRGCDGGSVGMLCCMLRRASLTAPRTALATPQDSVRRWMPSETSWNMVSRPLAPFFEGGLTGEVASLRSFQSPHCCALLLPWPGSLELFGGLPEYFEIIKLPLSVVGFCSR